MLTYLLQGMMSALELVFDSSPNSCFLLRVFTADLPHHSSFCSSLVSRNKQESAHRDNPNFGPNYPFKRRRLIGTVISVLILVWIKGWSVH